MDKRVSVVFKDPHCLLPDFSKERHPKQPAEKYRKQINDMGGDYARERMRRIICEFIQELGTVHFLHAPQMLPDGTLGYLVNIDVKYPRARPIKSHNLYPLEVLHKKGHITTMVCRPNKKKYAGLIFKMCPVSNDFNEALLRAAIVRFNVNFEPTEEVGPEKKYTSLPEKPQAAATAA